MHVVHHAAMSDLASFLKRENLSQDEFAGRIGVDQATVSRLARRVTKPGIELAARIERETNGEVSMASWVASSSTPTSETAA